MLRAQRKHTHERFGAQIAAQSPLDQVSDEAHRHVGMGTFPREMRTLRTRGL